MNTPNAVRDETVGLFDPEGQILEEALRELPEGVYLPDENPDIRATQDTYRRDAAKSAGVVLLGGDVIDPDKVLSHPAVARAKARMHHY